MEEHIEEIVKVAKENIVRDGYHTPLLIIKGTLGGGIIRLFSFGSNNEDNSKRLALIGAKSAKQHKTGDLQYLVLVAEAWMGANTGIAPSQDLNRMEALIVTTLEVKTQKQRLIIYQMVRNDKGELIELNRLTEAWDEVQSPLLPAFMLGYTLKR